MHRHGRMCCTLDTGGLKRSRNVTAVRAPGRETAGKGVGVGGRARARQLRRGADDDENCCRRVRAIIIMVIIVTTIEIINVGLRFLAGYRFRVPRTRGPRSAGGAASGERRRRRRGESDGNTGKTRFRTTSPGPPSLPREIRGRDGVEYVIIITIIIVAVDVKKARRRIENTRAGVARKRERKRNK